MKTLKEFYEETRLNPEGLQFEIKCLKCNSTNVGIETSFDYNMGSEYTGIYGEKTKVVIKCKDCGNAFSFEEY